jgi:uncharacterized protein YndB with AHSA1/START domain
MTSPSPRSAGPAIEPDGTLELTADGGLIRFERHLAHPVPEVWSAITEPDRLADWWLPFDADITVDLRVGGLMVFAGTSQPVSFTCEILQLEPPVLFEHTHPEEGSTMRWDLEPEGDGCLLRLTQFVPDPSGAIERCYPVGLHMSLSRLGPSLDGAPVPWDDEVFLDHQRRYAAAGLAAEVPAE